MRKIFPAISFLLVASVSLFGEPDIGEEDIVYKTVGDVRLNLRVFQPSAEWERPRPAIVLFFGGGWKSGGPQQFYQHASDLAEKGVVVVVPRYRIANKHETTPREAVMDAKSAMRWVYHHADELGVDPERIAAGGGSAGGHLAAATAYLDGLNEPGEDTSIPCKPDLLVLYNPVVHNGPGEEGYGFDRVGEYYEEISPFHNIGGDSPPVIFMLGSKDSLIPVSVGEAFAEKVEATGAECELVIYDGRGHGFFNYREGENPDYDVSMNDTYEFLTRHGYLSSE